MVMWSRGSDTSQGINSSSCTVSLNQFWIFKNCWIVDFGQFYVKNFEYCENYSSHVTSYLGEFLGRVLKWEKIRSSFRAEGSHGKLGTRLHKYFLHFYKTKKTPKLHKIIYFNERWHFDSSKHSNLILESGYNAIGQKWNSSQKYTILDFIIPF